MSKYDFIINLIDVKNRFRQIYFKGSYNKSNYFTGLRNVLPKSNTSEKVVIAVISYEIMKNIFEKAKLHLNQYLTHYMHLLSLTTGNEPLYNHSLMKSQSTNHVCTKCEFKLSEINEPKEIYAMCTSLCDDYRVNPIQSSSSLLRACSIPHTWHCQTEKKSRFKLKLSFDIFLNFSNKDITQRKARGKILQYRYANLKKIVRDQFNNLLFTQLLTSLQTTLTHLS